MLEKFLGIIFTSTGLTFLCLYLNLLTIGYSFLEFVKFINTRLEFLVFYLGIALLLKGWIKNVLFLRFTSKF